MKKKYEYCEFSEALHCLTSGGTLLYPTETFYALGCGFREEKAIGRIRKIKNRPQTKPFPLIAGDMKQIRDYIYLTPQIEKLAERFWPGPLSVLVRCKIELARELKDEQGFVCLRLTSHPVAQAFCLEGGQLLVATSANYAGCQPAASPQQIDSELKKEVDKCFWGTPFPAGGLPSTLVRFEGDTPHILRPGAISEAEIFSFFS